MYGGGMKTKTFTKLESETIKTFCKSLRELYGKGGMTEEWKNLSLDFDAWQINRFGRLLYISELEEF